MPPSVQRIRLGITNSYLVGRKGHWVLVDAGTRGWSDFFFARLAARGIRPEQVRLIAITHVHFDHVGSLAAIRQRCDCPVAVHRLEAPWLATGRTVLPPGTRTATRALITLARRHPRLVQRWYRFSPVDPEILVDRELSLTPFGVAARLQHTPGHTAGSLSVITESGDAMVGDLAVNYLPLGMGSPAPPFGDSLEQIRRQWRRLKALRVQRIHPAHGGSFDVARFNRWIR